MAKKIMKKAGSIMTDLALEKKYKGSGIASKVAVIPGDALWLPSRNIYLNYTMGGGIPYGKILEIYGGESSGKSLTAMEFVSCAQYLGGIGLWNDAEQSFDPYWAEQNGIDLNKIVLYPSTAIEKLSDWAADMAVTYRARLTHNEPIVLVTDSIAALDCEANINGVQLDAKAEMGNRAKALYKYLRIRNELFAELGIVIIFVNQLRKKVGAGMFEDPDTTPGGDAMKFFASIRMAQFQKKQITEGSKDNKVWLGNEVSIRMKKNKVAPPRPTFTTEVYFNADAGKVGFNKYTNLDQLLLRSGVIKKIKGKRGFFFEGSKVAEGVTDLQNQLANSANLRRKLIKASGVNTLSKTKKRLQELNDGGINRYPITIKKQKDEDE